MSDGGGYNFYTTTIPRSKLCNCTIISFPVSLYSTELTHKTQRCEMEQGPTASPPEEKQPVRPLKDGYLNDVFSIFKARQHPFVLLEESAMRWMGLRVAAAEVNITSASPAAFHSRD